MDKQSIIAIVGLGITILIAVFGAWVNIRLAVANLQVKVLQLEKDFANEKIAVEKYNDKIEKTVIKIFNALEEIKIKMASENGK